MKNSFKKTEMLLMKQSTKEEIMQSQKKNSYQRRYSNSNMT